MNDSPFTVILAFAENSAYITALCMAKKASCRFVSMKETPNKIRSFSPSITLLKKNLREFLIQLLFITIWNFGSTNYCKYNIQLEIKGKANKNTLYINPQSLFTFALSRHNLFK